MKKETLIAWILLNIDEKNIDWLLDQDFETLLKWKQKQLDRTTTL